MFSVLIRSVSFAHSTDGGEVVHDGDMKVPLLLLMESESTVFSLIMRSVPFVPEQPLPKEKYGNCMEKVGPYLAHMWKWYGKVG